MRKETARSFPFFLLIVFVFPGTQYPVTCNVTGFSGQHVAPDIDEICGRPADAQLRTSQLAILTRIGALSEKVQVTRQYYRCKSYQSAI